MSTVLEVLGSGSEAMLAADPCCGGGVKDQTGASAAAASVLAHGGSFDSSIPASQPSPFPSGQPSPFPSEKFVDDCIDELNKGRRTAVSEEDYLSQVENYLSQKFKETAEQPPGGGVEDSIPESETKMEEAMKLDGKFDMRGSVGIKWAAEKKSNPALAAAYSAIGRSYQAQRKFRAEWAARTYSGMKESRIKKDSLMQSDLTMGQYEPFQVIWGGG